MKRVIVWLLVVGYGVFSWQLYGAAQAAGEQIIKNAEVISRPSPMPADIISIPGANKNLVVMSWNWLNLDGQWAYASPKAEPINESFEPRLEQLTVEVGEWVPDHRADYRTIEPLSKMFRAARADGVELMVTSSYRSHQDQVDLTEELTIANGPEWAALYTEGPGGSEHRLGLAIDMTTFSPSCQASFSSCSISPAVVSWLAQNAPDYGFILRYPPGKQHITGLAYESWHYRYVGERAAKIITEAGITFDEFVDILSAKRVEA